MRIDLYDIARFFSRVEVKKQPNCWIYKGSVSYEGYPSFSLQGKSVLGHRFCYMVFHGEIEDGLVVRHKCDNPKCVNPYHLETGTHADNMRDKFVRDRTVKGSRNGRATLNEEQVMRIVEDGRTYQEIADEYGVCKDTIKNIMIGKNWSHVTGIKRKKRRK
jgi:hypothetical protein